MGKSGQRLPHNYTEDVFEQFRSGQLALQEALRRLHPQAGTSGGKEENFQRGAQEAERLQSVLKELDQLIGLRQVKSLVKEIYAFLQIQKRRKEAKLLTEPVVLHMIFRGNPGTGKTTVARIFARLLREMGVLSKGHLVEVERADLVGEYIGHTAQKTREHVRKALGGILFIDEAYSLARGGEKDFGKEAIDTLVKAMEDHKHDFVLILAGYGYEMDLFLQANPGLPSRFPIVITFEDYNGSELLQIAKSMLQARQYRLSEEAEIKLRQYLHHCHQMQKGHFANARLVRNIVERAIRQQAIRLLPVQTLSREELMLIQAEDLLLREEER